MKFFVTPTPPKIALALLHFGFEPEPKEIREDFTQWRKDIGQPLELYVDTYKNGNLLLYSRTGILSCPKGQRPNFITHVFKGVVKESGDFVRLLWQVGFIKEADFIKFKKTLKND